MGLQARLDCSMAASDAHVVSVLTNLMQTVLRSVVKRLSGPHVAAG